MNNQQNEGRDSNNQQRGMTDSNFSENNIQSHQTQSSHNAPLSLLNSTNRPLISNSVNSTRSRHESYSNVSEFLTRSNGDIINRSQSMRRRLSQSHNASSREISSDISTQQRLSSQNSTRKYFTIETKLYLNEKSTKNSNN